MLRMGSVLAGRWLVIGVVVGACGPRPPPPDRVTGSELDFGECGLLYGPACCEGAVCVVEAEAPLPAGPVLNCADGPAPPACPCIQGFARLGATGHVCEVDGPLFQGDGTAQIVELSCHRVAIKLTTGYLDATFAIARTPAPPCADTSTVSGRFLDTDAKPERWVPKAVSSPATLSYDCNAHAGEIVVPDGKGGQARQAIRDNSDGNFEIDLRDSGGTARTHELENCRPPP